MEVLAGCGNFWTARSTAETRGTQSGGAAAESPRITRHPYCEFSTILEGAAIAFVGREDVEQPAGDYFLAGPGVAHWYKGTRYPVRFAAIYFLPSVLIEMGPAGDGMRLLQRFSARQNLARCVVRPSPSLAPVLRAGFEEIIREFERKTFGHEVRLRTILLEMLVHMLRWEEQQGLELKSAGSTSGWNQVERALKFLREHFAEDVYARNVAAAAGVSESRLKVLFHEVLGMPWTPESLQRQFSFHHGRLAESLCQASSPQGPLTVQPALLCITLQKAVEFGHFEPAVVSLQSLFSGHFVAHLLGINRVRAKCSLTKSRRREGIPGGDRGNCW